MTGAQARATIRSRFVAPTAPEEVGEVRDTSVRGPAGDIAVRIYRPAAMPGPVPTLVYAHGGGFVFCDLDSHDGLCRSIYESDSCRCRFGRLTGSRQNTRGRQPPRMFSR